VFPGTYHESLDFNGAPVSLVGLGDAEQTVIDGSGTGRPVTFENAEGPYTTLQGFTITNGYRQYDDGGGILLDGTSPNLLDLIVTENTASNYGGGIYMRSATPHLERVTVSSNHLTQGSPYGVGIYVDEYSTATLVDCVISDNEVTADRFATGAGIYVTDNAALTMSGGSITDNTLEVSSQYNYSPAAQGAGLMVRGAAVVTLDNVLLASNEAVGYYAYGGALSAEDGAVVTLSNCWLIDNRADNGYGGAIHVDDADITLRNVAVLSNTADDYFQRGGGIYLDDGATATIEHSVFVGNLADQGGGIYLDEDVHVDIEDSVIVDNTAPGGGGGVYLSSMGSSTLSARYSNAWSNTPNDYENVTDPTGTSGNISVDPEMLNFTHWDPWEWDLHLATGSPLLDAGDPAGTDPDGSTADIGLFGGDLAGSWDLDSDGFPWWWLPGSYEDNLLLDPAFNDPATGWDCDDLDADVVPGAGC
jgi:predicted outer membrane repeat protein